MCKVIEDFKISLIEDGKSPKTIESYVGDIKAFIKSGRKDIMPDDITTALSTKPFPADNGAVKYVNPHTGTRVFVSSNNEIVGIQPGGFQD